MREMMVECQSFAIGRHGVVQHAVDAVLDGDFLVARFDVNIAGAPFERVEDGGIHQLDHRRDVGVGGGQLVDGERFVRVLFVADHVQREAFGDFFEHALRLLGLLEQIGDLRERGDLDPQLLAAAAAPARRSGSDCADRRARFRGFRSAPAAARNCSGTSDRPGWMRNRSWSMRGFSQIDELAAVARGQRCAPVRASVSRIC